MKRQSTKKTKKPKEKPLKLNGTFEDFIKAAVGKEVKKTEKKK